MGLWRAEAPPLQVMASLRLPVAGRAPRRLPFVMVTYLPSCKGLQPLLASLFYSFDGIGYLASLVSVTSQ